MVHVTAADINRALNPENKYIVDVEEVITVSVNNRSTWHCLPGIGDYDQMKYLISLSGWRPIGWNPWDVDNSAVTSNIYPFQFKNQAVQYVFTNTTNLPLWFEIYECQCRDNVYSGTTGTITPPSYVPAIGRVAMGDLVVGWDLSEEAGNVDQKGTGTEVIYTTGNVFCTDYGDHTPFESQQFCQNYKIIGHQKLQLFPAATAKYRMHANSMSYSYYESAGTDKFGNTLPCVAQKGSKFYLIHLKGCIGHSSANNDLLATTKTVIGVEYKITGAIYAKYTVPPNYARKFSFKQPLDTTMGAVYEGPSAVADATEES